ncbi:MULTISPECIES: sporulation protein YqfD [unclassified Flavonifractor]|uniref:sporulation protein YqfD n=1 Tax=unclassified Flavonifractor TaxID=2629267 RepID=UPI000B3AD26F|nr:MULTISPECIES: sporulation protein YqfD [unclassified Flavonifractor]OUO11771.1 sporulation protein [Flavonifractor sp. An4]HIZ92974.1 sporulation protein YqfD [Candidatus Flavonifractor avicola]
MLLRLVNALRGSVRLEVEGAFPERFLNLCAQRGILFWNVEWMEATRLRLTVTRRGSRQAAALGERTLCIVTPAGRKGMPYFLARFKKRYAFWVGMGLSMAAVCVLSSFVLTIEVKGNTNVPTAQILTELRRQGLGIGTFGPGLDERTVGNKVLLQLPQLSWLSINLYGTRAEVLVREAVEAPELVDAQEYGSVVARASGIVTRVEALTGEAVVKVGDTVLEGETLISGTVHLEGPAYSDKPEIGQIQVRASGRVYARTWRTMAAQLPLEAQVKRYTGEEANRWSVTALGLRTDFFGKGGISFDRYDKISHTWTLTLPGGEEMPLAVQRETCRAYELETLAVEPDAAEAMLKERLLEALEEAVGEGEIVSTEFAVETENGMLTVTLQAECREEIGRFVPDPITQENEADP